MGFGAKPSKVDAQVYQSTNVKKLKDHVLLLQEQIDELRALFLQGRRQNEVTCAKHENIYTKYFLCTFILIKSLHLKLLGTK